MRDATTGEVSLGAGAGVGTVDAGLGAELIRRARLAVAVHMAEAARRGWEAGGEREGDREMGAGEARRVGA